jgi:hypothetical protein
LTNWAIIHLQAIKPVSDNLEILFLEAGAQLVRTPQQRDNGFHQFVGSAKESTITEPAVALEGFGNRGQRTRHLDEQASVEGFASR